MNRTLKLLVSFIVVSAIIGGLAAAASSPSVTTSSASSITTSSALLRGAINPNGGWTNYRFVWGLAKNAYGAGSPAKSAGHDTTPKAVAFTATHLIPGTVYHYRLTATSRFGNTIGADRAFRTKGYPPPAVATGGVAQLGVNTATLTGLVNPHGAITAYFFQYGTTPLYGYQTFPAAVPGGRAVVPVSQTLTGLAQFTTFHYRLVARHGSVTSYGADQAFVTFASPRFGVRVSARERPRRDRFAPYVFAIFGHIRLPSQVPPGLGCAGNVSFRYFLGRRNIAFALAPVQPNCTFASLALFRHLPGHGKKRRVVHLRVRIFFRGNGYVAPTAARPQTVSLGRR